MAGRRTIVFTIPSRSRLDKGLAVYKAGKRESAHGVDASSEDAATVTRWLQIEKEEAVDIW